MELRDEMKGLVGWVLKRAEEMHYGSDDHHTLYHEAAAEFDLYDAGTDGEHHAPIWLSRVVAGVLQDRAEGLKLEDGEI
jgi:hypothetical protein